MKTRIKRSQSGRLRHVLRVVRYVSRVHSRTEQVAHPACGTYVKILGNSKITYADWQDSVREPSKKRCRFHPLRPTRVGNTYISKSERVQHSVLAIVASKTLAFVRIWRRICDFQVFFVEKCSEYKNFSSPYLFSTENSRKKELEVTYFRQIKQKKQSLK